MDNNIKENNAQYFEDAKEILWEVFSKIRSSLNISDYSFILFLFHFVRSSKIDFETINNYSTFDERMSQLSKYYKADDAIVLKKIYDVYQKPINSINISSIADIISILNKAIKICPPKLHLQLFDDLLFKLNRFSGKYYGEFLLPNEVASFVMKLTEIPNHAKIYNPFAGFASFGILACEDELTGVEQKYFAQELNHTTWAIGLLRLIVHDKVDLASYIHDDSIKNWNSFNQEYDLIIANPPFGKKILPKQKSKFGDIRSCEHFLVAKGLDSINSNGKLVAIIPSGFLHRQSDKELRKYLVENDLLEIVISFPGGLLSNTGIPFSIIVINNSKVEKEHIRFIDAESFVEKHGTNHKRLNSELLLSDLKSNNQSDRFKIVHKSQVSVLDYNLSVLRYFYKEIDGISLGSFAHIFKSQKTTYRIKDKFVRIRDLGDNSNDNKINYNTVKKDYIPKYSQIIDHSCLLVATQWKSLKPVYFEYVGKSIYVSNTITALKIDQSQVNINYLVNELNSDYIKDQIDKLSVSDVVPFIKKDDLLSIKIVLPTLSEQKAKISGISELSDKLKEVESKIDEREQKFSEQKYNEFASLKHTLGTPRQNILSYAETLLLFFNKENLESFKLNKSDSTNLKDIFETLNEKFKLELGQDLSSVFENIKTDITFISQLLEKGEKGLILEDYNIETIPLNKVLAFIDKLCLTSLYNFTIYVDKSLEELKQSKQSKSFGIKTNLTLLKVMFENIFTNAQKHAFLSKKFSDKHEVVLDVLLAEEDFVISIINNGEPFPSKFTKEKFITKYSTGVRDSGSGLGGYDIDRIIHYFGGNWELISKKESNFPVQLDFHFPRIIIE